MNLNAHQLGAQIASLRKDSGLTQKQLGEKLFVTDRAVSKWERGISAPNIFLLVPLSEALGVTVDELLRGCESSVSAVEAAKKSDKQLWFGLFSLSASAAFLLLFLLYKSFPFQILRNDILVMVVLMLVFGAYFCFFAKPVLPYYYDKERIGHYQHGPVRMNVPGVSFNNGNWFYFCRYFKAATSLIAVFYPLLALVLGPEIWTQLKSIPLISIMILFVAGVYITDKRHK